MNKSRNQNNTGKGPQHRTRELSVLNNYVHLASTIVHIKDKSLSLRHKPSFEIILPSCVDVCLLFLTR